MPQIKNVPQIIFLQQGIEEAPEFEEDIDFYQLQEISWSTDKIHENDLVYYNQSTVNDLLEVLNNVVEKVEDGCDIENDEVLEAYIEDAKQLIKNGKTTKKAGK